MFGVFSFSSQSWSCGQGLEITSIVNPVDLTGNTAPTLNVVVNRKNGQGGNGTCSFFIVLDTGGAASSASRQLDFGQRPYPFQFYSDAGRTYVIKPLAEIPSVNEVVAGQFATNGNTSRTVSYHPYLDDTLYLENGPYNKVFTLTLYRGTIASATIMDSKTLNFVYTKSKKIDISLVDTSAVFNSVDTTQTLDFGALATGQNKNFDLIMQYNSGFQLSMSSANSNRIKNATNDFINYAITLNGSALSLTNALALQTVPGVVNSGVSPVGGLRLPIGVTIGNVTGAKAGTYTDTVSISVSAN